MKVVSDRAAARALVAKDVAAVVGWSQDLAPLTDNDARLRLVAPSSGAMIAKVDVLSDVLLQYTAPKDTRALCLTSMNRISPARM